MRVQLALREHVGGNWLLLGALALLAVVYYAWTWGHELPDFGGDNAYYLLIARHFSPYSGPSQVAAYFFETSLYPPLYPFFLAILGGGDSVLAAHIVTTSFLLLAFATFFAWLRTSGLPRLLAMTTTLLFALLPGTYLQTLDIHSENLYLALSLGALAAAGRAEASGDVRWLWVATAAVALATLSRSAGVALLIGFAFYVVVRRQSRGWLFALIALMPMLLWKLWGEQGHAGYLGVLVDKFSSGVPTGSGYDFLRAQLYALSYGWYSNFGFSRVGRVVSSALAVLALAGAAYRLYQRKLDGAYAASYVALLIIWPFPAEAQRLVFVIIPVLLGQALLLVARLPGYLVAGRELDWRLLALAPVYLVVLPTLALTAGRFVMPVAPPYSEFARSPHWYGLDPQRALAEVRMRTLVAQHLRHLRNLVPPDDCIYSIKPSIVGFYADRISKAPPRDTLNDEAFATVLKESGCRFFHLAAFISPSFRQPFYPADRLATHLKALDIVHLPESQGPAEIVAVLAQLKDDGAHPRGSVHGRANRTD